MKNNFYYNSQDHCTKIHSIEWIPEGPIKAVLQISHGMVEFIDRYDEFAHFLNEHGYYVVGQDHLGHGESVTSDEKHGYFSKNSGNKCVIQDIDTLYRITKKKYPNVPYFLLGHSMGSFLIRQYIIDHTDGISGVIIMGTGNQPSFVVKSGRILCQILASFKGWKYRSNFVNHLAFGGYNKKFSPARTSVDWLSRNTKNVDEYLKNPWCTFIFTLNGYYNMFLGMESLYRKDYFHHIPESLPVLFVSGKDDPVGDFGKGVYKVYKKFKKNNMTDVSLKLYEKDRHEILNETDRKIVFQDLLKWMDKRI